MKCTQHDEAMKKFEQAIALLRESAYLEYSAAQQIENKLENEPTYSLLWVSAANLNRLISCHERVFECAIHALRGNPTKHLKGQLCTSLMQTIQESQLLKITTDILDSSNDYVQLMIQTITLDWKEYDTDQGVAVIYEDFNRFYWFDDPELRPRLIAVLEKHGFKQGVNFLIPTESTAVIQRVTAIDNILDSLKAFLLLLEDLGGLQ